MKLRGLIYRASDGKKPTVYKVACYLAKGLGVICYDSLPLDGKTEVPLTMCVDTYSGQFKKEVKQIKLYEYEKSILIAIFAVALGINTNAL